MRRLLLLLPLLAIVCDACAGWAVNQIAQSDSHWALAAFAALCVSLIAAFVTAFAFPAILLLVQMSSVYRSFGRR